jgi:nucleoside-diphosphate-sugar epimerase
MYQAVNINGTKHVLEAAQKIGATVAIVTASGSIGVQPPSFFLSPFARWPVRIFQIVGKVKASTSTGSLSDYGSCYAYSKAVAESHVLASNNSSGLRTGCIRPGHAIYGAGVSNVSSISWSYLSRGGSPSWLWDCVTNGEALGSILARTSKKHANEDALVRCARFFFSKA